MEFILRLCDIMCIEILKYILIWEEQQLEKKNRSNDSKLQDVFLKHPKHPIPTLQTMPKRVFVSHRLRNEAEEVGAFRCEDGISPAGAGGIGRWF